MMTTLAALMAQFHSLLVLDRMLPRDVAGLVIVGGLIFSQLITLFVTPVIYLWLEWFQEHVSTKCRSCEALTLIHEGEAQPDKKRRIRADSRRRRLVDRAQDRHRPPRLS